MIVTLCIVIAAVLLVAVAVLVFTHKTRTKRDDNDTQFEAPAPTVGAVQPRNYRDPEQVVRRMRENRATSQTNRPLRDDDITTTSALYASPYTVTDSSTDTHDSSGTDSSGSDSSYSGGSDSGGFDSSSY